MLVGKEKIEKTPKSEQPTPLADAACFCWARNDEFRGTLVLG